MADKIDTLITSDPAKLPPDIAALLDTAVPLPTDVRFFEKRFEIGDMVQSVLIAIILVIVAVALIAYFAVDLFDRRPVTVYSHVSYWPLGAGVVSAFGAWLMLMSIPVCLRLRAEQLAGRSTRRGTFLTPAALVQASENDTTIIPPTCFIKLEGADVKYRYKQQDKSYRLPASLVNATPQELHAAINAWSATHPATMATGTTAAGATGTTATGRTPPPLAPKR